MQINRIIKTPLGGEQAVAIELTPDELLCAYREQEHLFEIQDAEYRLSTFVEEQFEADEERDEYGMFESKYGFSYAEAVLANGPHYMLDDIADEFIAFRDCNYAENESWSRAIKAVLERSEDNHNERNKK